MIDQMQWNRGHKFSSVLIENIRDNFYTKKSWSLIWKRFIFIKFQTFLANIVLMFIEFQLFIPPAILNSSLLNVFFWIEFFFIN